MQKKARVRQLILAVYRVANALKRRGEAILASQLKEQANHVLKSFVIIGSWESKLINKLVLEIEILQNFFEIAKAQYLIKEINFVILDKEFAAFKREILEQLKKTKTVETKIAEKETIEKVGTGRRPVPTKTKTLPPALNERQQKLMSVMKKRREISISDVSNMFKGQVSDKTVRRDLIDLINKRLIGRKGDKRWTKYFLK